MNEKDEKNKSLFGQYQSLLASYPLLMNIVQGSILSALSVLTSQYLTSLKSKVFIIDYVEIVVMTAIMAFFITPVLVYFYSRVLDRMPGGNFDPFFILVHYLIFSY